MKTKLDYIIDKISPSKDLVNKEIKIDEITLNLLFLKNMIDLELLNQGVLKPLISAKNDIDFVNKIKEVSQDFKSKQNDKFIKEDENEQKALSHKVKEFKKEEFPKNSISEYINENIIFVCETSYEKDENSVLDNVLRGNAVILINEGVEVIKIDCVKYTERGITEPPTSVVINGPRAGFVESINTNLSLIRRRICDSSLKIEEKFIGRYTKTKIAVCYMDTIADKGVVDKINEVLDKIDIDGIIDSEYLVNFLSKRPYSIIKQVGKTEKPDIAVAKMLEGRVIILVDGTPIALSLPFLFLEDLQSSGDYYQKNYKVIFLRIIRLFGSFVAILLPGMYVAMETYHYKLLPTKFLVTILNSTQGLPLTPFLEVLFVIILFEILYESSIRMPKYMGMALSIVGALILGDTAVKAGLVSSPSVMIIALSGITIYTVPEEVGQLSLYRLFFVFLGGVLGMFGITVGFLTLIIYACSLDSYGVPYFAPVSPFIKSDLKDTFNKVIEKDMVQRPQSLKQKNKRRKK